MEKDPTKEKIDSLGWQLLHELDLNARQSYSSLGKKLRLSKEAVAYRIRQLQARGIIRGFNLILDPSALGYIGGRFMIKMGRCTPHRENEIIDYFTRSEKTWWVNSRAGTYNLGVAVWAKDIHEFYKFQESFLNKYRENFSAMSPGIYHRIYHFPRSYLWRKDERKLGRMTTWEGKAAACDDIDHSILRSLAGDSRLSTSEIARRLGLTPAIVKYRMRRMENDGIILGYRAQLDLKKLGYYWYKVEFYLSDFSGKDKLLAYVSAHPNVTYAYEIIGAADLELEVEVQGADELLAFIDSVRARFPDLIENYDYYLWSEEHKIAYVPPR